MKFKHQLITTCLVGFLLGGMSSFAKAEQPSWMIELPKIMCLKNVVWLVWVKSEYAVQVEGIFCSLKGDLA